jgi:hypothetical protein
MDAIDFLKNKLEQLVVEFPMIKCSYEFENFDNSHVVEILPNEYYDKDELLNAKLIELDNEFIKLFPYHGLYFISENSLYPVKNPIFKVKGQLYKPVSYSLTTPQISITPVDEVYNYLKQLSNFNNGEPKNDSHLTKYAPLTEDCFSPSDLMIA